MYKFEPFYQVSSGPTDLIRKLRSTSLSSNLVHHALYGILKDVDEVERIFLIIKQQTEY